MIEVRQGQAGLAPLAAALADASNLRNVVLVANPAARVSAETIAVRSPANRHPAEVRVVTPADLARAVLTAAGRPVFELVDAGERWRLLRDYLARHNVSDHASDEQRLAEFGRAFDDARLASAGPAEITVHASAAGTPTWLAVADLLDGWSAELRNRHVTDRVGLLCDAMSAARLAATVQAWWASVDRLVVADANRMPPPTLRTLTSLLGPSRPGHAAALLWGISVPVRLLPPPKPPTPQTPIPQTTTPEVSTATRAAIITGHPAEPIGQVQSLVRCGHPALEAEAVVGELIKGAADGTRWAEMVVVAPSLERLRAVARAARRAGVPISGAPAPRLDGPVVAAVAARARAAHRGSLADEPSAETGSSRAPIRPDQLMRTVVAERAEAVVTASVEGETLVALLSDATLHAHLSCAAWADRLDSAPPAPPLPRAAASETVELCTIDELLDRVDVPRLTVLTGCIEGVLPSRRSNRIYDPAVLGGPGGVSGADLAHLTAQRERFASVATATSQQGSVVYIAAPEPGVLVSRFTEGIAAVAPTFAPRHLDHERWPVGLAQTVNPRPLISGESLHLSASQINLFDNCPWQHTVQYRLNLRTEGGLQARFGTYIHTVLERFVAGIPGITTSADVEPNPHRSTLQGLLTLADDCWTDDITDYAPQEDDYRGRAAKMLTDWWHRDGQTLVSSERAAYTEYHFDVAVGQHVVTGFIDRIDAGPDGLSIIDYKTAAKAKSTADTNEDLQLAVYHLAANLDPTLSGLGPVVALNLDFLAENKQVAQQILPDHVQRTTERIVDVANRMLAETALPSVDAACDYCDLARLCDLQAEGRAVPVRFQPTRLLPASSAART